MRRSIVAVPFIYGLAGIGAMAIVDLGGRLLGRTGYRAAAVGAAIVLVAASGWNIRYYFGDLVQDQHVPWVFADDLVDSLRTVQRFDDPGTIYFYSARWSYRYETRRFLLPGTPGIDRSREHGTFDLGRLHSGPVTYILLGHYQEEIDRLRELHPGGEVVTALDDQGRVRFAVYHLRREPAPESARGA